MNEEEAKEAYFELKIIEEQMNQVQHQIGHLEGNISEFENSLASLKEIEGKDGEESFVPLSPGVYAKARIADTKKLVVNVGAGVAVEKSPQETAKIIEKQLNEMRQYREQMIKGLQLLGARAEEVERKVAEDKG